MSSVTPIKDIVDEKKVTDPVENDDVVEKNDTVAAKGIVDNLEDSMEGVKGNKTPLKESVTIIKERPQVGSSFKLDQFNHPLDHISEEEKVY